MVWMTREASTMPKKTEAIASLNIVTARRESKGEGESDALEEREGVCVQVCMCVCV